MNTADHRESYEALSFYTLSHIDQAYFIHQLVVDAYTAQCASESTKPIALTFALAGLYLVTEKNYSGRAVQRTHMLMAKHKKPWPRFVLPPSRGGISVADVMAEPAGPQRDAMIKKWCGEVWSAYASQKEKLIALLP